MASRSDLNYAVDRLVSTGMSRTSALGAIGSLMGESGRSLNTRAHNPNDPNGGSVGIGQWHSERRTALESFARQQGKLSTDFKTQVDFIAHELKTTERRALKAMQNATTLQQAAKAWTDKYERPAAKYAHHAKRYQNALYAERVVAGKAKPVTEKAKLSLSQARLTNQTPVPVTEEIAAAPQQQGVLGQIGQVLGGLFGETPTQPAVDLTDGQGMTGGRFSGSLTPDGSPAPLKADGTVDYMAAAKARNQWAAANNPFVDYNDAYPGIQGPSPQQMNVARGLRDPIGDMFKAVALNAAAGPLGVGTAVAKQLGQPAQNSVIAGQQAKTQPKNDGFFGDANLGGKIGAIGGSLVAGQFGGMVGGIVGQALSRSLSNIGFDASRSMGSFGRDRSNEFPDAPTEPSQTANFGSRGGNEGRSISDRTQAAIDAGTGGLY